MDEAELGRRLRETTEKVAREAAEGAVRKLGAGVEAWARQAAAEALRPTLEAMARLRVDVDGLAASLTKHDGLLQGLDTDRVHHDYAEMHAAQGRLEAARGEVLAGLEKTRGAMVEESDRLQGIVAEVVLKRADAAATAQALSERIETVAGELTKAASQAAEAALEKLAGERLAEIADFEESCRTQLAEEIVTARKMIGFMLSDAQARVKAMLEPAPRRMPGKIEGLQPRPRR